MTSRHAAAEPPGDLPPVWPGSTVDAAGRSLFVRRAGSPDRPPAVFVHGLGGASTNWTDLMGLLADVVAGHAPDLPGHGRSAPPAGGRYDLDSHVAAVVGYIESQDLGPVHLFGNSMGGAISTRIAAERPDLVRSLTLISPALPNLKRVKGSDPLLPLLLVPGLTPFVQRYLAQRTPERRVQAVIEVCFADPSRVPPQRLAEAIAEAQRRQKLPWALDSLVGSLRGLVRAYVDRSPRNLWLQAATVQAPTLLIYGKQDRMVSFATAARAAAAFPHSRLLALDHVGHVAQIEEAATVAAAVGEHLAEVDRALSA